MTGRVALVTGAARGIGAATVRRLAEVDYRVIALDSCSGERLPSTDPSQTYTLASEADLAATVEPYGDRVVPVVADVRDRIALDAAVADAVARWGRLDVAVAGAAVISGGRPLWESSAEELELLWAVDVAGVWNTAAAAIPAMLANPDPSGCRFVAIGSAAGSNGLYHLAGYATAKHAVVGLVKGLAADLIGTGVTATVVAPGSTRTEMLDATARIYGLEDSEEFARSQLIRRLLDPDEIAATVAFCCSSEGAIVNGSIVHADGGFRQ